MTRMGSFVTIRGEKFKVVGIGPASTDKKFFGKRRFTLRKLGTTDIFFAFGKSVTHNSRLIKEEGN